MKYQKISHWFCANTTNGPEVSGGMVQPPNLPMASPLKIKSSMDHSSTTWVSVTLAT